MRRKNYESFTLQMKKCVYIQILATKFAGGSVHKPACKNYARTSCRATCPNNPTFNQLLEEVEVSKTNSTQTSMFQFHSFLWATIISWIGMAVVVSVADAICFNLLG